VLPNTEYLYPNFYNCQKLSDWFVTNVRTNLIGCIDGLREDTIRINKLLGIEDEDKVIDLFHLNDLIHTRQVNGSAVRESLWISIRQILVVRMCNSLRKKNLHAN